MDISNIGAVEKPSYRLRYIDSKGKSKSLYFSSMEAMNNARKVLKGAGKSVTEESLNPALVYDREADDYFKRSNIVKDLPMERDPFPVTRPIKKGTYRVKKVSKGKQVFYAPADLPMFEGSRYIKGTDDKEETSYLQTALIITGLYAAAIMWNRYQLNK